MSHFAWGCRYAVDSRHIVRVYLYLCAQPFGGPARACFTRRGRSGLQEAKRNLFTRKMEPDATLMPDWTPDFSFHCINIDLSGARGSSALRIAGCTLHLASLRTIEHQAHIRPGPSKLSPAIRRGGTRRSFEHTDHSRFLIPLGADRSGGILPSEILCNLNMLSQFM
jgi:hypothetical protein